MATFNDLLRIYRNQATLLHFSRGMRGYASVVSSIQKCCPPNDGIEVWVDTILNNNTYKQDPLLYVNSQFNKYVVPSPPGKYRLSDLSSAIRKFIAVILGYYNGNLQISIHAYDELFCQLIAENALFVSKDVYDDVVYGKLGTPQNRNNGGNQYASWDFMKTQRDNNIPKGQPVPGTAMIYNRTSLPEAIAENNNSANSYIKNALLETYKRRAIIPIGKKSSFYNYTACHVWGLANDRRYFTSVGNIVLIPSDIYSLTDHNQVVMDLLKYEVNKRFNFCPNGYSVPSKPSFYSKLNWRQI